MERVSNKIYSNSGNKDVLLEIIGENLQILDVGCGSGANASILGLNGHILDGITLSKTEAAIAKKFMRHIYVKNLEEGLPILNCQYDYIICSHVLEHIANPQKLFNDLQMLMTDKTKLIIAVPNLMHYNSRFKLLIGDFNYEESGIWDYTHVRWYTFKSAQVDLIKRGFLVEKAYVTGDLPLLSITKVIPLSIRKCIFYLLTLISKGLFGGQLIFVVTKSK
jgi:SAM-dependent methyltransferase